MGGSNLGLHWNDRAWSIKRGRTVTHETELVIASLVERNRLLLPQGCDWNLIDWGEVAAVSAALRLPRDGLRPADACVMMEDSPERERSCSHAFELCSSRIKT